MNHLDGIRRNLQEAEGKSDGHGRALRRVPTDGEGPEYHRVDSRKSEAVPDHLIIGVAAEFLLHNDHGGDKGERPEHFLAADLLDFVERLNAYCQHGEAYKEGIAVGEIIGKVESVEGEICPVVCHQQNQNSQQTAEADAGSQSDLAAGEEYRDQQHGKHRTKDIRQIVAAFGGRIAVERAGENIPEVEIARYGAGKFILRAGGFAQRHGGGNENPHGEHSADSRRPYKADEVLAVSNRLFVRRKTGIAGVVLKGAHDIPQHKEYADHVSDVVIGGDGYSERDAVKQGTFPLHDLLQPEDNERQQHEAVQPHDVPRIGDKVGVKGIRHREGDGTVIILFEYPAAENREGCSGRCDL